jgi:alcohol dehydrogenase class IV
VPTTLSDWLRQSGLSGLTAQGLNPADYPDLATAALTASSMKANPVALAEADLLEILSQAAT